MKTGAELIAEERKRQIEEEGWAPEHDDQHIDGDMAAAAAAYAFIASSYFIPFRADCRKDPNILEWPWDEKWWKPSSGDGPKDRICELVKAGALIAAEIDRLQRTSTREVCHG